MAEAILPANSVGIWAFGPSVTRFVPLGYHPEVAHESKVEKTKRVADGLADVLDGLEYHYPGEVNEGNVAQIREVLETYGMELPVVASGLHPDPTYALGSLINPDPALRRKAIDTNRRGVELAAAIGASFIVWPGSEGYNYLFQRRYADTWKRFVDGVAEITQHAASHGVKVFLEHKNSEPTMKILMRSVGMTLFVIEKVRELGVDTSNLPVNMDWQHLIMNGENLGEYADLLAAERKLGHQHGNDGWGSFDDHNMVGTKLLHADARAGSRAAGRRLRHAWRDRRLRRLSLHGEPGRCCQAVDSAVGADLGSRLEDQPRSPGRCARTRRCDRRHASGVRRPRPGPPLRKGSRETASGAARREQADSAPMSVVVGLDGRRRGG